MTNRLRRLLHEAANLRHRRWLSWMGPALHHPSLWHMSRRGISLGVGIGVFFGLLLPLAQIPAAAVAAVVMRANVPVAAVSTLVSNPITFPPIYYAAYRIGHYLTDERPPLPGELDALHQDLNQAFEAPVPKGWWSRIGKPATVGLLILATTCGLLTYALAGWVLRLRTQRVWKRRIRRRERRAVPRV